MKIQDIVNILEYAKRPIDVFGGSSKEDVKKRYKEFIKICHPDLTVDKDLANKVTILLNEYYEKALIELDKGIYNTYDEKDILMSNDILFEFNIRGKKYTFYKYLCSEDVCDVYEGICDDEVIVMRIVMDEDDNKLINHEEEVLRNLDHYSLPKIKTKLKINNKDALIFNKDNYLTIRDIKRYYENINGEHICWILERLLSLIGYLHSKKIVHGNIKEENVLIDIENHNVLIKDYTLCITDADKIDSKYKIINDYYTPSYINDKSRVLPSVDIYAVGLVAVNLLGGDIERIALPISVDIKVRTFIRKLLSGKENDAWALWDELINIRNEVYGSKRFQVLKRKVNR